MFRNTLYWIGFQAGFAAQLNRAAARAGVLWQRLIMRGAGVYFGTESCIVEPFGTFFDEGLRSFGEINEWVSGRYWTFELDEGLFERTKPKELGELCPHEFEGPPEFLSKRLFMKRLVTLFHDMGAVEMARQYEWWTAKSQPNVLKRLDTSNDPYDGLTAIDFRAGLVLLPFLPMSPADFRLILQGLARGSLVQFDRPDLRRFETFVRRYRDDFADLEPAVEELRQAEKEYRDCLPDITHRGHKLFCNREVRKAVVRGTVEAWRNGGWVDDEHAEKLVSSRFAFLLFLLARLLPGLGRLLRRLWGDALFARHAKTCMRSFSYLKRTLRARLAAALIEWERDGRVSSERALTLLDRPVRFWTQRILLFWAPASWHRFLTDGPYAWDAFKRTVGYPIRFYRDEEFRKEWLLTEIREGCKEGMLSVEEEAYIASRVDDPFIQKYLKCVAIHLCTLPVTQVISIVIAIYVWFRFGKSWQESTGYALMVLAFFQGTPISPGPGSRLTSNGLDAATTAAMLSAYRAGSSIVGIYVTTSSSRTPTW